MRARERTNGASADPRRRCAVFRAISRKQATTSRETFYPGG